LPIHTSDGNIFGERVYGFCVAASSTALRSPPLRPPDGGRRSTGEGRRTKYEVPGAKRYAVVQHHLPPDFSAEKKFRLSLTHGAWWGSP
jgi:hypothetical protein